MLCFVLQIASFSITNLYFVVGRNQGGNIMERFRHWLQPVWDDVMSAVATLAALSGKDLLSLNGGRASCFVKVNEPHVTSLDLATAASASCVSKRTRPVFCCS